MLQRYSALFLTTLLLAGGCAHRAPVLQFDAPAAQVPARVELIETPFISQQRYQCGPAALAMVLQQSGVTVDADDLVPHVYLPQRKGSLQIEMTATSRRYDRIPYLIAPTVDALTTALRSGYPVLVLQNLALEVRPVWHFAVVIGYEKDSDSIILRSGTEARLRMPAWLFLKTWQSAGHWGLIVLRPGTVPQFAERPAYLETITAMEGISNPGALLEAYRSALARWPDDSLALFGLANTLQDLQRFEEAGSTYRRILDMQPDHIAALNNLAHLYAREGCYLKARKTIHMALSLNNEEEPFYTVLLDTLETVQAMQDTGTNTCDAGY